MKGVSIRIKVQLFFFIVVSFIISSQRYAVHNPIIEKLARTPINAITPFGGVASLYRYTQFGDINTWFVDSNIIMFAVILLLALLFTLMNVRNKSILPEKKVMHLQRNQTLPFN